MLEISDHNKITFEDEDINNHNSMVKQFYFIRIPIVAEVDCWVDNLEKGVNIKEEFTPYF